MRVRCRLHLRMSWITIRQSFAGDETIQESSPDTGRMSRDTTEDHFRCVVLPTTQSEWACTYRQLHTQIKIYVPPLHSGMLFFRTPSTTAVLRQRKIGINVFPSVHLSDCVGVFVLFDFGILPVDRPGLRMSELVSYRLFQTRTPYLQQAIGPL